MSLSFTLSGTTSRLTAKYFPAIQLEGEWEIGLLNFTTYNSIPNVYETRIIVPNYPPLTIPAGAYELADIATYINTRLRNLDEQTPVISIHANQNTLRTEVRVSVPLEVDGQELVELMGITFNPKPGFRTHEFLPGEIYTSEQLCKISRVNVVRILCNLAYGSYINDEKTHSLHEFAPNVPAGYKICEVPGTVIYYPINTSSFSYITLEIVDQSGQPIDFSGENITIRLHLRRKA